MGCLPADPDATGPAGLDGAQAHRCLLHGFPYLFAGAGSFPRPFFSGKGALCLQEPERRWRRPLALPGSSPARHLSGTGPRSSSPRAPGLAWGLAGDRSAHPSRGRGEVSQACALFSGNLSWALAPRGGGGGGGVQREPQVTGRISSRKPSPSQAWGWRRTDLAPQATFGPSLPHGGSGGTGSWLREKGECPLPSSEPPHPRLPRGRAGEDSRREEQGGPASYRQGFGVWFRPSPLSLPTAQRGQGGQVMEGGGPTVGAPGHRPPAAAARRGRDGSSRPVSLPEPRPWAPGTPPALPHSSEEKAGSYDQ